MVLPPKQGTHFSIVSRASNIIGKGKYKKSYPQILALCKVVFLQLEELDVDKHDLQLTPSSHFP